jgi:hypothetical protein
VILQQPWFDWGINTYMLGWLISRLRVAWEQAVLVDYGGGSGYISFLAKALGIGKVIYADIYDVSCRDAGKLGEMIGFAADYHICGELPDVVTHLIQMNSLCDMLCSHDCIEHIYDVERFVHDLAKIPANKLVLWLSTSANPMRRKTRRMLMEA